MVIRLHKRSDTAVKVQEMLTTYGCSITTRIGLHETGSCCSNDGLILLGLTGPQQERQELLAKLNDIPGVAAATMAVPSVDA